MRSTLTHLASLVSEARPAGPSLRPQRRPFDAELPSAGGGFQETSHDGPVSRGPRGSAAPASEATAPAPRAEPGSLRSPPPAGPTAAPAYGDVDGDHEPLRRAAPADVPARVPSADAPPRLPSDRLRPHHPAAPAAPHQVGTADVPAARSRAAPSPAPSPLPGPPEPPATSAQDGPRAPAIPADQPGGSGRQPRPVGARLLPTLVSAANPNRPPPLGPLAAGHDDHAQASDARATDARATADWPSDTRAPADSAAEGGMPGARRPAAASAAETMTLTPRPSSPGLTRARARGPQPAPVVSIGTIEVIVVPPASGPAVATPHAAANAGNGAPVASPAPPRGAGDGLRLASRRWYGMAQT